MQTVVSVLFGICGVNRFCVEVLFHQDYILYKERNFLLKNSIMLNPFRVIIHLCLSATGLAYADFQFTRGYSH